MKEKLEKASDQFRVLHDLAEKGALQIKCDVLSLEKQAQKVILVRLVSLEDLEILFASESLPVQISSLA